jgi:hypothetical protein
VGYLRSVYGSRLVLPFNLEALEFFYLNTALWRQRNPRTFWPMQPCGKKARPWPSCPSSVCRPWRVGLQDRERRAPVSGNVTTQKFNDQFRTQGMLIRRPGLHWRPSPNDTDVEVMRTMAYINKNDLTLAVWESCTCTLPQDGAAYGCWLFSAKGTGLTLNMRRSLIMENKKASLPLLLQRLNASRRGMPLPRFRSRSFQSASLPDKYMSYAADQLGYDTVQVLRDDEETTSIEGGISEIVVTPRYACESNPTAAFEEFRKMVCLPVAIARADGGPCACQKNRTILNCGR